MMDTPLTLRTLIWWLVVGHAVGVVLAVLLAVVIEAFQHYSQFWGRGIGPKPGDRWLR